MMVLLSLYVLCGLVVAESSETFVDRMSASFAKSLNGMSEVEWSEERSSPLLDRPLRSAYRAKLKLDGTRALITKWKINRSGDSLRNDSLLRGKEMCFTSTMVDRATGKKPVGHLGIMLFSNEIGKPSREPGIHEAFRMLGNNMFVGQVDLAWVSDYLKNSEVVAGDVVQLSSETELGLCSATLDPKNGYLPLSLRIEKQPHHICSSGPLSEIKMNGGKGWPSGGIKKYVFTSRVEEFGVYSGTPYIKKWSSEVVTECEDGTVVKEVTAAKVTSVGFDKAFTDADLRPDLKIPFNHSVSVDGATQLSYYWDGDWASPRIGSLPAEGRTPHRSLYLLGALLSIGLAVFSCRYFFSLRSGYRK